MTTVTKKRLKKSELAELAARAMNLLSDMRSDFRDEMSMRQENEFNELAAFLPDEVRTDFYNNATVRAQDLV